MTDPATQRRVRSLPIVSICAIATIAVLVIFFPPRARLVAQFVESATLIGVVAAIVFGLTFYSGALGIMDRLDIRYQPVRRLARVITLIGFSFLLVREASLAMNSGATPSTSSSGVELPQQAKDRPASTRCPEISTGWSAKPVSLFEYWNPTFCLIHRVKFYRAARLFTHTHTNAC